MTKFRKNPQICSGQSEPRVGAGLASPASLRLKFPAAPAAQITRKTEKYTFTKYKINKSKNHYLSKVMLMTMLR